MFGDDLGLKTAVSVARYFYRKLTKLTFEGFLAFAVAGVAIVVGHAIVFGMAKVLGHLCLQGALYKSFGELLE